MKITVMSDLHLEFAPLSLDGGDVLVLAGDVCEARLLVKDFHTTRHNGSLDKDQLRFLQFFYEECAKYKHVIYVAGNHEHYYSKLPDTIINLKRVMPDFITVLEKDSVIIDGVRFVGGTMWSDFNKADPMTMFSIGDRMNDFRLITSYNKTKTKYFKFYPKAALEEHNKTIQYFDKTLSEIKLPTVVISHHGPSYQSIHPKYTYDREMNGGYCSDVEWLMEKHDHIKYWFHGHVHNNFDYMVNKTRVICNPRGYHHENLGGFNKNLTLEI